MFDERLSHEKQAAQIYIQYEIVIRFGHVPETGAAFDAALLIKTSTLPSWEAVLLDETLAIGSFGDVSLNGDDFRAVAAQALSRVFLLPFYRRDNRWKRAAPSWTKR